MYIREDTKLYLELKQLLSSRHTFQQKVDTCPTHQLAIEMFCLNHQPFKLQCSKCFDQNPCCQKLRASCTKIKYEREEEEQDQLTEKMFLELISINNRLERYEKQLKTRKFRWISNQTITKPMRELLNKMDKDRAVNGVLKKAYDMIKKDEGGQGCVTYRKEFIRQLNKLTHYQYVNMSKSIKGVGDILNSARNTFHYEVSSCQEQLSNWLSDIKIGECRRIEEDLPMMSKDTMKTVKSGSEKLQQEMREKEQQHQKLKKQHEGLKQSYNELLIKLENVSLCNQQLEISEQSLRMALEQSENTKCQLFRDLDDKINECQTYKRNLDEIMPNLKDYIKERVTLKEQLELQRNRALGLSKEVQSIRILLEQQQIQLQRKKQVQSRLQQSLNDIEKTNQQTIDKVKKTEKNISGMDRQITVLKLDSMRKDCLVRVMEKQLRDLKEDGLIKDSRIMDILNSTSQIMHQKYKQTQTLKNMIILMGQLVSTVETQLSDITSQMKLQSEKREQVEKIMYRIMTSQQFWTSILTESDKSWLLDIIQYNSARKISRITLRFVASQHLFNVDSYHRMCNSIDKQLVVIKTKNSFITGGFSNGIHSFIFSSNNKIVLKIKQNEQPMLQDRSYGPIFGSNCDLRVGHQKIFSNLQFVGNAYDKSCLGTHKADQVLIGTTEAQLEDYEIFEVQFQ